MDVWASKSQIADPVIPWGWGLQHALKNDDPAEALRWFSLVSWIPVDPQTGVRDSHCSGGQPGAMTLHLMHRALNSAMCQARIRCARVLLDLIADASELDTVSQIIRCPEPSSESSIDVYHPPTSQNQPTEAPKRSSHLHVAAALGSSALVDMVITASSRGGAAVEGLLAVLDSDLNTPLIILVRCSPHHACLPAMKALLRGRPDAAWVRPYVDTLNGRGLGALHYAVARGLDEVVMYLLDECQACVDPYRISDPEADPIRIPDVDPFPDHDTDPFRMSDTNAHPHRIPDPYAEPYGIPDPYAEPYRIPDPCAEAYRIPDPYADPYRIPDPDRSRRRSSRCAGFSPLHVAIMRNNHWAVGRLLAAGADVNLFIPIVSAATATLAHAELPASCDCGCGFVQPFRIAPPSLFSAAASFAAAESSGVFLSSTLALAAYVEDGDTVEALVQAGALVDERDSWGSAPLNVAVFCSNYTSTLTLLSLGADVGACVCGRNLLHVALSEPVEAPLAARHCKLVTVNSIVLELLLAGTVDVNGRDGDGNTPLILACRNGYFMTVPLLAVGGSSLSSVDPYGLSALFYAACYAGLERQRLMVRSLVHFGAACLELEQRSFSWEDGRAVPTWSPPALAALFYLDTLTLFLLYKGGALRHRGLLAVLKQACLVPRSSELWLSLVRCGPTAVAPGAVLATPAVGALLPSPRNRDDAGVSLTPSDALSTDDAERKAYRYEAYTPAEMEDLFRTDESDWESLLSFCDLSEHHCSLEEHDAGNPADQSDGSSSGGTAPARTEPPKLMQLTQHFLQTVSTTVPSLLDLCRWAVRDAIGDDPLARKRAMVTLPLPSLLTKQLMIGCMPAV